MKVMYPAVSFLSLLIRIIVILCICTTMFLHGYGQPALIRQQEKRLNLPVEDTSEIYQLLRQGKQYMNYEPDSAIILFKEAKRLSRDKGFPDGVASALVNMAQYYRENKNMARSVECIKEAKPYFENAIYSQKDHSMAVWHLNMARAQKPLYLLDSAIYHLYAAEKKAKSSKDTSLLLSVLLEIGDVLIRNNKAESSIPYFLHAQNLVGMRKGSSDRRDDNLIEANLGLAKAYGMLRDTMLMYTYSEKVLSLTRDLSPQKYKYLDKARSIAYCNLVNYYFYANKPEKAMEFALKALEACVKNNDCMGIPQWGISLAHYKMGQYKKAKTFALLALEDHLKAREFSSALANLYRHLAKVHNKLGEYAQAYQYHVQFAELWDSLNSIARNKAIDKLEAQYRLVEQEKVLVRKENQLLVQENKVRNRNKWIAIVCGGIFVVLLLSGLLLNLYRNSRRKIYIMRQQQEIDELKAMMTGEEKERNRIAMELHDNVGGLLSAATYSLDSIKNEAKPPGDKDSIHRIRAIIGEVRSEIRKTAHTLMPDVLLQQGLPEAVRMYCGFTEQDTGLLIDVQSHGIFDALPKNFQLAIYRIIQELIQNILKHAKATDVLVQLHAGLDLISLTLEDNGQGFDPAVVTHGMGLQNIKKRLALFNGRISVDSTSGKGTSVYIEFVR